MVRYIGKVWEEGEGGWGVCTYTQYTIKKVGWNRRGRGKGREEQREDKKGEGVVRMFAWCV